MQRPSLAPWILMAALGFSATLAPGAPPNPSPEPPPPPPPIPRVVPQTGPVRARLVVKKGRYVLDRKGLTAEKYREAVRAGKITPPAVDLALELINTSGRDVRIRVSGASPRLTLDLKGAGVVSLTGRRPARAGLVYHVLKPGQIYSMPITSLAGYQSSTQAENVFWTEPGKYNLTVSFRTYAYTQQTAPVPVGGGARVVAPVVRTTSQIITLTTQPVRLEVTAK